MNPVIIDQLFNGLIQCYTKFNLRPEDVSYSFEEYDFRNDCLREELAELIEASSANNEEEVIDAIIDLLVFAIGTSYRNNTHGQSILAGEHLYSAEMYQLGQLLKDYSPEDSLISIASTYIAKLERLDYYDTLYQVCLDRLITILVGYLLTFYKEDMVLEYYARVITANMSKEIGGNSKRNNFQIDLVKPEGWKAPNFDGLSIEKLV